MSDVVETILKTDYFESPAKNNGNVQAQEQEVKDCTEFLKIEYTKYRRFKIILECLEECVEDDSKLDPELGAKIKQVILGEQVSQIQLSTNSNENRSVGVLGVPSSSTELSYPEGNRLHSLLKAKLVDKCLKFKAECNKTSSNVKKSESPLELGQDDITLLNYRDKLVAEQETYIKNQKELLDLLENLKRLRLETVPDINDHKYEECKFKTHINYLKSQLARDKHRVDVFMESNHSLNAYTEIMKDMKEQQDELQLEIEKLKDLKQKYADVACKEYDDILKSYLQYQYTLKKKKLMFDLTSH